MDVKAAGMRAVMLYIIQRSDVAVFAPAVEIDPDYAKALEFAVNVGVEVLAMQAKVTPEKIELVKRIPFELKL